MRTAVCRMTTRFGWALSPTCLIITIGLYFYRVLLGQGMILSGDAWTYFLPLTIASVDRLKQATFPLWTPLIHSGFPLWADGQAGALYPPTLVLFLALPPLAAYQVGMIVHLAFAGLFMYAFAREIGLGSWAALYTGLAWTFSSPAFMVSHPSLNVVAWWPLLFLLAERLVRARHFGYVVAAGIVLALQLLAGFPQMTFFSLLAASLYFLLRLILARRGSSVRFVRQLLAWSLVPAVGLGLAAVQLLPTYELSQFSMRSGGMDFAFATDGSLLPTGLMTLLFPQWRFLTGPGVETPPYFGILSLALVLATVFTGQGLQALGNSRLGNSRWGVLRAWLSDRVRLLFSEYPPFGICLILAAFFALLGFGKYTPLYGFLFHLPGFDLFRIPSRFLHLTIFFLTLLAGMGLERVMGYGGRTVVRVLVTLVAIMSVSVVVGNIALRLGKRLILSFAESYTRANVYGSQFHVQSWEYYQAKIMGIYEAALMAVNPSSPGVYGPLLVALVGLTLVLLRRRIGSTMAVAGLLLLTMIDLLLRLGGFPQPSDVSFALSPPKAVAAVRGEEMPATRVYKVLTEEEVAGGLAYDALPANYNMLFGVPNVGVYSALGMKRYYDFLGDLGSVSLGFGLRPVSPEQVSRGLNRLSLLNVKYILSKEPLKDERLELIYEGIPRIYRNRAVLPRAFVVADYVVAQTADAALALTGAGDFDPTAVVVLEENPPTLNVEPSTAVMKGAQQADIVDYRDTHVVVSAAGPGWLTLADTYYPGWRVFVDGVESRIYRADYVLRAVPLEPGQHQVEFVYDPVSFKTGLAISSFALLAVLVLGAMSVAKCLMSQPALP